MVNKVEEIKGIKIENQIVFQKLILKKKTILSIKWTKKARVPTNPQRKENIWKGIFFLIYQRTKLIT